MRSYSDAASRKLPLSKSTSASRKFVFAALRVVGERLQVRSVPARGGRVLARFLRLLRLGVMVGGEVRHVALQVRDDLGLLLEREPLPVRAARTVGLDEILLALEHEIGELALLERLDDLDLQQRRLGVIRVELDERVVSVGGVLKALLLEIEVAEVRVGDERVRPRAVPTEVARDRLGAVEYEKPIDNTRNVSSTSSCCARPIAAYSTAGSRSPLALLSVPSCRSSNAKNDVRLSS